jgi:alkanesulfonate monooxygenase SsuD/methylene tetrahydromethanopterin reductase-like flavin-dependent oxidoreductase (luciferase family)
MTRQHEFGLDTFGDVTIGPDGELLSHAQVLRNVVEEAVLADRLGLDFFGVGEHHREDFAISAPEVVLAAIAGRTERIRLGTLVTGVTYRHPSVLAAQAVTDRVSELGVCHQHVASLFRG